MPREQTNERKKQMSQSFWKEMESLAASAAETVVPALLGAYLNKGAGVPGAPAFTIGNVGRIAGSVAAASVLQHYASAQAAAVAVTADPPVAEAA
jgi:hypothetical protein